MLPKLYKINIIHVDKSLIDIKVTGAVNVAWYSTIRSNNSVAIMQRFDTHERRRSADNIAIVETLHALPIPIVEQILV